MRIGTLWDAVSAIADARLVILGDRPPVAIRRALRRQGVAIHPPRIETPARRMLRLLTALGTGRCIPAARYLSERRIERLVGRLWRFRPDVVIVGDEYLSVLLPALAPLGARLILDTHNAASRGHARVARSSRSPGTKLAYALLAWNTASTERRCFPLADEIWAVSPDDAAFYQPLSRAPVRVVPNVVALPPRPAPAGEPGAVAFAASFGYWPNEDAALRLIAMAGRLRASGALRTLSLVGKAPTPRMVRAAARQPGVVVTGAVPDVAPYLARAAVIAVPLGAGSGTKLKVLEAMAAGKAVVTTPVGAEGLGLAPGVHADVVPLEAFEPSLAALLRDEPRRAALAAAGRAWVAERFSTPAAETAIRAALLGEGAQGAEGS